MIRFLTFEIFCSGAKCKGTLEFPAHSQQGQITLTGSTKAICMTMLRSTGWTYDATTDKAQCPRCSGNEYKKPDWKSEYRASGDHFYARQPEKKTS